MKSENIKKVKQAEIKKTAENIIEKQISSWYYGQKNNYKKHKQLLNNENITKLWIEFIDKYKQYFPDDDIENWLKNYNDVIIFINKYSKKPSSESKDKDEKQLGHWLSNNINSYNNKKSTFKNLNYKLKYEALLSQYPHLFIDREEYNMNNWFENFKLVNEYILLNNKKPIGLKNSTGVDLNIWLSKQLKYMKHKDNMLSRNKIYLVFNEFYLKYRNTIFETLEEQWINNLNNLKTYIDKEHEKPSKENKDKYIKTLGQWLSSQKSNYKDKIGTVSNKVEIKNIYEQFLKDYKEYL
jgi:hypothetical protein